MEYPLKNNGQSTKIIPIINIDKSNNQLVRENILSKNKELSIQKSESNVVFNNKSKNTLLHKCTTPEVYELLIKSGANINALNDGYYKETPLEHIITKINPVNYCNSLKLVKLLIYNYYFDC